MATSTIPDKPEKCIVNSRNIPRALKEVGQWTLWKWHWNGTKWIKFPIQISGDPASSIDPATWASFDSCWDEYRKKYTIATGLNFASGKGIGILDLDDCVGYETGIVQPHVECMLRQFEHTACEYSPSKKGIRIFFHVDEQSDAIADAPGGFEFFAHSHFGTVTGDALIPGVGLATIEYNAIKDAYREYFGGKKLRDQRTEPAPRFEFDEDVEKLSEDIRRAVDALDLERSSDREEWIKVLCALKDAEDCGVEGLRDTWHRFSKRCNSKYDETTCNQVWDKHKLKPVGERISFRSLFHWKKEDSDPFIVHSGNQDTDVKPALRRYAPVPVETLPDQLREFVVSFAESAQCPQEYVALPALAACAAMIGNAYRIRFSHTWTQPSGLWVCCVGRPGSNKSAGFKEVQKCVAEVQRPFVQDRLAEIQEWKATQAKKGAKSTVPQPLPLKLMVADVTSEAMALRFLAHRRGLFQACEELSGWFASHDQYKAGGKGGDAARFIAMYDAGILEVDRVGSGKAIEEKSLSIPLALLSIAGTIQPQTLRRSLGDEHLENGLAMRFLYTHPPEVIGRPHRRSRFSAAGMVELLVALHALPFGSTPAECEPDQASGELFLDYWDELDRARREAYDGPVASMLDKHKGVTLRLALVLHVLEHIGAGIPTIITVPTMKRAIELSRWCCGENERVLRGIVASKVEQSRETLLEIIRHRFGGAVTPRQLMTHNRKKWPTAEIAETALNALEKEEWGGWVNDTETGGRPARRFSLF